MRTAPPSLSLSLSLSRRLRAGLPQAAFLATAIAAFHAPAAHAQSEAPTAAVRSFSIPAQPLAQALNELARQANLQMGFAPALVAGKTSASVTGELTAQQALDRLLAGTGLAGAIRQQSVLVQPAPQGGTAAVLPTVSVLGTAPLSPALPATYAGGQVARGGRLGLLGNRDLLDTPFSATHYTAQLVEDQQAQTIGDVLVNDPSVRNTYARSAGREEFNIRGFTLFNYDVSFNGLYGVSPRNAASLIGVERVEVLRGPNALLNGMAPAGSVGGGINLVPKRAGATPLNRLTFSTVDDGQLGAHADLSRRFGQDQEWGVRLNAAKRSGDTPVHGSKERVDALALGLDYQGERVRLEADINYQNRVTHGRSSLLFPPPSGTAIPAAPNSRTNFQPPWSFWDAQERAAVVRAEVDLTPDLLAFGAAGAMQYEFDSLQTTSLLTDAQGALMARPYRLRESVDTQTAEAGLRGRVRTGALQHEWVLSATAYGQDNDLLRQNGTIFTSNLYTPADVLRPTIALGGSLPRTGETRLRSVALADTVSFADRRVQLTLGARHQQVITRSFGAAGGALSARYDESAVTPMAAVLWKAADGVSLYANYIEGLGQGPTAPAGSANAGEVFPPSKSKQAELGAKFDTGSLATTVSVFQIERPNGMLDLSTNPPAFRMAGRQRNRGLELLSQGEAARGVRLLAGAAYTQGKLTQTEGGALDGSTAPATPRLQLNLGGEWDTAFLPGLTLTARGLRTSAQYVDMDNTQRLSAWTRWDLGARYRFNAGAHGVTLRASVENVFDKNFWQSAAREGLTVGAPRTLLVSVTTEF